MAEVILKNIKKVYPHQEPAKKKKGSEEKKTNLQITDEGVLAVQEFSLNIADKEFIVLVGPSGCGKSTTCLLYTSPSPRDRTRSRMPSSA